MYFTYRTTRERRLRLAVLATVMIASATAGSWWVPDSPVAAAPRGGYTSAAPGATGLPAFGGAAPEATAANAPPVVRASEDFEHGTGTAPRMLDQYVGSAGQRYRADPSWIDPAQCNGVVTSRISSDVVGCSANAHLRNLSDVLGQVNGTDPRTNHAVSAWTLDRSIPASAVEVEATEGTALGASGRFVSFGVDAAAASCDLAHPLLAFSLVEGTVERPVAAAIDPCTDRRARSWTAGGDVVRAGSFVSPGGLLLDGTEVRWRLRNQQTASEGNDGAIDGVSVFDSTPRLVNSFAGTPVVGGTARMTARVVNTSELGSKPGWSFSERLPEDVRIAAQPRVESACRGVTVTAGPGDGTLTVRGDLAADAVDCTVSLDVTSDVAGTGTLDREDVVTHRGVDLPEPARVTFLPEQNALVASERPVLTGADAVADLGEALSFATTVRNGGNTPVHDLRVVGTAGPTTCGTTDLAPAASTVCSSAPRPVVQADLDAGAIDDAVTATATSRAGQRVTATASARVATTAAAPTVSGMLTADRPDHEPTAGDPVTLHLTVRNDGNVTLRDLTASVDGRGDLVVACPGVALAPGASTSCAVRGTYPLTRTDVDRGAVDFAAPIHGRAPDGTDATARAETSLPLPRRTELSATASAELAPEGHGPPRAGDRVAPGLVVRNTGNTTVRDVTAVADDRPDLGVRCPAGELPAGASVDCEVDRYPLTQEDVDAGRSDVRFSVGGTGADDARVAARAAAGVDVERRPVLEAHVTAHLGRTDDDLPRPGDHVASTVTVANAGNVTLRGPSGSFVEHPELPIDCPESPIAPDTAVTCTVPDLVLTQDDVERGLVPFTLHASAVAPSAVEVTAEDAVHVGLRASDVLDLQTGVVRRGAGGDTVPVTAPVRPGDRVAVLAEVRHTGNLVLHDLRRAAGGDLTCAATVLEPGAVTECTGPFHTVTEADLRAGEVVFTSQVEGDVARAGDGTEPGARSVVVSSATVRDRVPVVAVPGALAFTGSEVLGYGLPAAVVLLLLGAAVAVARLRSARGSAGRSSLRRTVVTGRHVRAARGMTAGRRDRPSGR